MYCGTYGIYAAFDSSPLNLFLIHLNEYVDCPRQVIVGYNHRQPDSCKFYEQTIRLYSNINWKYLVSFHSKYFIVRKDHQYMGFAGSFNFSDTTYDNLAIPLTGVAASVIHKKHSMLWRRARKTPPERKTRRKRVLLEDILNDPVEFAADTGYQPVSVFSKQLEELEENYV